MELMNAKGTKDFLPEEKILREEIIETLKKVFEKYGYNPLETPIIERYDILAAKFAAGETSDALKETFTLTDQGGRKLGLRYELTFALARVIGMNPALKMPFKRYQIGEVFRDGPVSTGRMRQFWQCDVDVVGIKSVIADAEILAIVKDVFSELKLDTIIEVNNRKLLNFILEEADIPKEKKEPVLIIIDKLKKIGKNEVIKELKKEGISQEQIKIMLNAISLTGTNNEKIEKLKKLLKNDEAIEELEDFFAYLNIFKVDFIFNPSLARGLGYYTGPIYEVYLKNSDIKSSIAAGGRWDKMIGGYLETEKEYPATGIAFGLEPITEAIKKRKKYIKKTLVQLYLIPIKTEKETIKIITELRKNNIKADMDLTNRDISKNLDYANKLQIPYVIFVGKEELKKKKLKLKDMKTGKEKLLTLKQITTTLINK